MKYKSSMAFLTFSHTQKRFFAANKKRQGVCSSSFFCRYLIAFVRFFPLVFTLASRTLILMNRIRSILMLKMGDCFIITFLRLERLIIIINIESIQRFCLGLNSN